MDILKIPLHGMIFPGQCINLKYYTKNDHTKDIWVIFIEYRKYHMRFYCSEEGIINIDYSDIIRICII